MVSKSVVLATSDIKYTTGVTPDGSRIGNVYFDKITTTLNAYAKEKTAITYEYSFGGYNIDSFGNKFSVVGVNSIVATVKKGGTKIKEVTPSFSSTSSIGSFNVEFSPSTEGEYTIEVVFVCNIEGTFDENLAYSVQAELSVKRVIPTAARDYLLQIGKKTESGDVEYGKETYSLTTLGIYLGSDTTGEGEIIVSEGRNKMPNQSNLVPSIFRETYGAERFYEATNGEYNVTYYDEWEGDTPQTYTFTFDKDGEWDGFANPFGGEVYLRREHIVNIDDIKPTIKEATYKGVRIDKILDVAFDRDDSNEFDENGDLKHPYFFVKLNKMGFNLFAMASEQGEMTISMTSGDCNSCNFTIGVGENTKRNIVEVDSKGQLVRDENGNVKVGEDLDKDKVYRKALPRLKYDILILDGLF